MTANLTASAGVNFYGAGGFEVDLPQSATAQIYMGAMVAETAAGAVVTGTTAGSGHCVGVALYDQLGGATDGAVRMAVHTNQTFLMNGGVHAPTDATLYGTVLFMETDNTVGTGVGGQTQIAGRFEGIEDDGRIRVFISDRASWFDANANLNDGGSTPFHVRAVITSIAAYTGSTTGVLTASGNGAIGAQDGLTLVAGDCAHLPGGITNVTAASDTGPYVVTSPGSASTPFVLTRPSWWQTGQAMQLGSSFQVGGEGTVFKATEFKSFVGKGKLIDTDDPLFYVNHFRKTITLSSGTYKLGAGGGGGEMLFLYDTTLSSVQLTSNTHAGTIGTSRLEAPSASRVAGYPGTAVIVVNSLVDAGTVAGSDSSTVDVLVTNW